MYFTVANHGERTNATGYINYPEVEFSDIPAMATSGSNYCACKLKDEYRLDNNFDGCVDVLIIDVDESCNLEQAKTIFKKYKYWIITSKSHQKDKGGIVCDRFRIFIELDKTIHIRQKMEIIYNQFIDKYPFIDTSCKNVSRFFFSSPKDALVIKNEGKQYSTDIYQSKLDKATIGVDDKEIIQKAKPRKHIPSQGFIHRPKEDVYVYDEVMEYWSDGLGQVIEGGAGGELTEEQMLDGIQVFLDNEYMAGQRAVTLFKTSSMMKKDGFDEDFIVDYLLREFNMRGGDKLSVAKQNIMNAFKYD